MLRRSGERVVMIDASEMRVAVVVVVVKRWCGGGKQRRGEEGEEGPRLPELSLPLSVREKRFR